MSKFAVNAAASAAATPIEIDLDGETYKISPLSQGDIAELDQWIKTRYLRQMRASVDADAPMAERRMVEEIAQEKASKLSIYNDAGRAMTKSLDGWIKVMYISLRRNHPGITEQDVCALITDETGAMSEERINTLQTELERANPQTSPPTSTKSKKKGSMKKKKAI